MLFVEHALIRLAIAAAQAVPERGVLAVVIVEGQVVDAVTGGAVHHRVIRNEFAIVDQNGPNIDKHKERNISQLLKREQEREGVVGDGLSKSIKRVEGMRGKRRGHDPFVVRLVQALVDERVMQPAVDPVDAEVGEHDEEGELQPVVEGEGRVFGGVVELAVAAHLGEHQRHGAERHEGHGDHGLFHLEDDLVAKVLGMLESLLVEDQVV